MPELNDHLTVRRYLERKSSSTNANVQKLNARELRGICLELGMDDVGFVEIGRPSLADQREDIMKVFPWTKTLVSFVGRINRENLRSPARSIASLELRQVEDRMTSAAHKLVAALERKGVRAASPPGGFPMEADQWLGKMFVVSHKAIAVAAGLGKMGLHRNVIHPVFGSFVLLNTVIMDAELDEYTGPLEFDLCLDCKLCSTTCPTGAIGPDGFFNPINCLTHTYRELIGGFTNWVETIADSKGPIDYRAKTSDAETVSMWQSLAYGPCYKSVYCMAVCPAGDEVIPQYLENKKAFVEDVVKPFQQRTETVYVLPGSDAESHVARKFPHKKIKLVGNGIRPPSVASFLWSLPIAFQRHKSEGLSATYHFRFSGIEQVEATIVIKDKIIKVHADAKTWLCVLHKESSMFKEIVFRRIRVKGPMKLFKAFGECFA
jgi:NAD-dependent dihydropyrimidine dehydrogenase PreA subunit